MVTVPRSLKVLTTEALTSYEAGENVVKGMNPPIGSSSPSPSLCISRPLRVSLPSRDDPHLVQTSSILSVYPTP
jgi:hypothetical protein